MLLLKQPFTSFCPSFFLKTKTANQYRCTPQLCLALISLMNQALFLHVKVFELILKLILLINNLLQFSLFQPQFLHDNIQLLLSPSQSLFFGSYFLRNYVILAYCNDPLTNALCCLRGFTDFFRHELGVV